MRTLGGLFALLATVAAGAQPARPTTPAPTSTADRQGSVRELLRLAKLDAGRGDQAAAAERLRRALALAPNSEDVLFAHAQMALSRRALTEALSDLEALSRMWPAVSQYHYLLGVALMQAGDMTGATEALQRANEVEPDRALTLVALGLTHNSRRRHQEARDALLRSLDFEPDNLEAIAALAEAEEGLGETATAESHAAKVLARMPGHANANLVMGLVLMKQERYAEARDAFLKAAGAEDASAKPHYQLSLAYSRLGDEVRARQQLENYQRRQKEIEDRVRELRGLSPGGMR